MAKQEKKVSDKGIKNTIRNENTQRILINNMKEVIRNSGLHRSSVPYEALVANTNSALIPYNGPPAI